MHLLGLVKMKIRSWLGSCRSRYNYDMEDCCLNRGCYSTRLFKDRLGNLIHVRQDRGPNQEKLCRQLVSPPGNLGKCLELGKLSQNRGGIGSLTAGLFKVTISFFFGSRLFHRRDRILC